MSKKSHSSVLGEKGAQSGPASVESATGVTPHQQRLLSVKNSTLAVQCQVSTPFAKLRSASVTTLLSTNCTCAKLHPISLS